ncbi:MAG: hypothetical protein HRT57_08130 [Crocinitomicaceae bacterium]|nr:hypothetical protein [Crocinitomicaceae bacterium]
MISYAQSSLEVENLSLNTDSYILYRGFENEVKITFNNSKDDLEVVGINCEIVELENHFIVKPNSAAKAYIKISKGEKLIRTLMYDVSNVPDPFIYLGKVKSGWEIVGYEESLSAKYLEEINLKREFKVKKTMLFIDGGKLESTSDKLSEEMLRRIQMADSKTVFNFNCFVECEDGVTRIMSASFTKE